MPENTAQHTETDVCDDGLREVDGSVSKTPEVVPFNDLPKDVQNAILRGAYRANAMTQGE